MQPHNCYYSIAGGMQSEDFLLTVLCSEERSMLLGKQLANIVINSVRQWSDMSKTIRYPKLDWINYILLKP